jgi:hypothetical protein
VQALSRELDELSVGSFPELFVEREVFDTRAVLSAALVIAFEKLL